MASRSTSLSAPPLLSLPLSLSPSPLSLSHPFSLSLSPSLPLTLSPSLSHPPSHPLTLSPPHPLSPSLTPSLSLQEGFEEAAGGSESDVSLNENEEGGDDSSDDLVRPYAPKPCPDCYQESGGRIRIASQILSVLSSCY